MPEEKLPICCNELEEFLINTCNCAFLEAGEIKLRHYETYLEKIRPFFVSTLEERIYDLLERFIYSEDAVRFQEQFPCLRNCIGQEATTLSTRVNENCENHMAAGIVVQDVITRAIKCLIKEGVFGAFINSLVLNNRINRIGRQLDALDFQKNSLAYLNVCNYVCEKNYWIDHQSSQSEFDNDDDDDLSDLAVEVSTEDQNSIGFQASSRSDDELRSENDAKSVHRESDSDFQRESSSSYQTISETYLRTTIATVEFSPCGCVDVRAKLSEKLKLPCKSDDLIKNIHKVDQNCSDIGKEFDQSISNVCSRLNNILMNVDDGTIKNLCLICEIRPGYISFKLKSLLTQFRGSKSFLFSTRVSILATRNNFSTNGKNKIQRRNTISQKCIGVDYCRQNCLSVVSEEEEEINEETIPDVPTIKNDFPITSLEILSEPKETSLGLEDQVLENGEYQLETPQLVEIIPEQDLKIPEIDNSTTSKIFCPCDVILSVSTHSFSQIDLKLQDLSECLKKFTNQNETIRSEESNIDTQLSENRQVLMPIVEEVPVEKLDQKTADFPVTECLCSEESLQKVSNSLVTKKQENNGHCLDIQDQENRSSIPENQVPREVSTIQDNCRKNHQEEDKNFKKSEKSPLSKIPIRICCQSSSKIRNPKEKREKNFPSSQRESSNASKIPVLRKKDPKGTNSSRTSRTITRNRNSSIIPPSDEKREGRSTSASRRRSMTPSSERSSELSRCFATKSTVPKSNPSEAKTYNKTSTNVTLIKVNVSSTFLSKVPQPAKRNVPCPPPRRCLPKIDQCVCTESFPSVLKVDRKISANILPNSEEKPTFVIVTDSEEAIPMCDSECPCRGRFDIPNRSVLSCLCSETSDENLKLYSPNCEFPSNPEEQINPQYQENSNAKNTETSNVPNVCDSLAEFAKTENLILKEKSLPRKEMNMKLKTNTGKMEESCLNYQMDLLRDKWILSQNLRSVSVQTEGIIPSVLTEGININIRGTRESNSINVQREQGKNSINLNLISKESVISLHTNVTKIISIIDVTIFENTELRSCRERLNDIRRRGIPISPCCPKQIRKATLPNDASRLGDSIVPKISPYPGGSSNLPLATSSPALPFLIQSSISRKSNSRNSSFNLKTNIDSIILDKRHQKIKSCGCGKSRKIDSWLCPKSVAKAQNIFKAICEPFSQKSIDRMKYLIRRKLCHLLLDQEGNSSKSFVSSERYYVSVSKEKNCSSVGNVTSSQFSLTSSSIRRTKRMAGGCDNPAFDDAGNIRWEFEGECKDKESIFFNQEKEEEEEEKEEEEEGGGGGGGGGKELRREKCVIKEEQIRRGDGRQTRKINQKEGKELGREKCLIKEEEKQIPRGENRQRRRDKEKLEMVKRRKEAKNRTGGRGRSVNKEVSKRREMEKGEAKKVKMESEQEKFINERKDLEKKLEDQEKMPKRDGGDETNGSKKMPKRDGGEATNESKKMPKRDGGEATNESKKMPKRGGGEETNGSKKMSKRDGGEETNKRQKEDKIEPEIKTKNCIHIKSRGEKRRKHKSFISPGDMITSYHLGKRKAKFFRSREGEINGTHRESDKENGANDSKTILQGQFNFNNERGQFSLSETLGGKNRFSPDEREGSGGESFSDLERNVRSKLREYLSLCKSVKYIINKGSNNVYSVASRSNSIH